ncbi:MAG: MBL fold metallo-hydrolase, partial [Verrucomicrobiota bacterium]|nr:MBL fold metallo-hydrolase [Verrucomicrobiota bacterium]
TAPPIEAIDGFEGFTTPYGDVTVNAFLIWDPTTKRGFAFDTGADAAEMLAKIEEEQLRVEAILLTHSHPDHIAALSELRKATGAPVYLGERESVHDAEPIAEGRKFAADVLEIETLLTWGHSKGGVTYFVRGLERPLAIVGDSIFAGSMGGGSVSYQDALQNNREKILSLPNETIICPGHGPLTTVEKEKNDNPFFAGKISE